MVDKTAKQYRVWTRRFEEFLQLSEQDITMNDFTDIKISAFLRMKGIQHAWSKSIRKTLMASLNLYLKLGIPPKINI